MTKILLCHVLPMSKISNLLLFLNFFWLCIVALNVFLESRISRSQSPLTMRTTEPFLPAPRSFSIGSNEPQTKGWFAFLFFLGLYQPFLHQTAIKFLDIGVDALIIRNTHVYHILHLQKLSTVCIFPGKRWANSQLYPNDLAKQLDYSFSSPELTSLILENWIRMQTFSKSW